MTGIAPITPEMTLMNVIIPKPIVNLAAFYLI
jgi:hypothetical protein